jgi:hypothetical protein
MFFCRQKYWEEAMLIGFYFSLAITIVLVIVAFPFELAYRCIEFFNKRFETVHLLLEPDSELGYKNKKNFDSKKLIGQKKTLDYHPSVLVKTNSLGHRVSNYQLSTASKQVYILGDSQTFGWSLNDDETCAAYLEKWLLSNYGKEWGVINAGVNGYCSRQMLIKSMKEIPIIKPKIVIIYSDWNTYFNRLRYLSNWKPGIYSGLAHSNIPDEIEYEKIRAIKQLYKVRTMIDNYSYKLIQNNKYSWKRRENLLYEDQWKKDMALNYKTISAIAKYWGGKTILCTTPGLCQDELSHFTKEIIKDSHKHHVAEVSKKKTSLSDDAYNFWALVSKVISNTIRDIGNDESLALADIYSRFSEFDSVERLNLFCDLFHATKAGSHKAFDVLKESIRTTL